MTIKIYRGMRRYTCEPFGDCVCVRTCDRSSPLDIFSNSIFHDFPNAGLTINSAELTFLNFSEWSQSILYKGNQHTPLQSLVVVLRALRALSSSEMRHLSSRVDISRISL